MRCNCQNTEIIISPVVLYGCLDFFNSSQCERPPCTHKVIGIHNVISPKEGYYALQPAGDESRGKATDGTEGVDAVGEGDGGEEGVCRKPSCS